MNRDTKSRILWSCPYCGFNNATWIALHTVRIAADSCNDCHKPAFIEVVVTPNVRKVEGVR